MSYWASPARYLSKVSHFKVQKTVLKLLQKKKTGSETPSRYRLWIFAFFRYLFALDFWCKLSLQLPLSILLFAGFVFLSFPGLLEGWVETLYLSVNFSKTMSTTFFSLTALFYDLYLFKLLSKDSCGLFSVCHHYTEATVQHGEKKNTRSGVRRFSQDGKNNGGSFVFFWMKTLQTFLGVVRMRR